MRGSPEGVADGGGGGGDRDDRVDGAFHHDPSSRDRWRSLHVVAMVGAAACFGLGVLLGRLTAPDPPTTAAVITTAADVTAATSSATDAEGTVPPASVAGAVEIRSADMVAASVDDLVIVAVAATTCGERSAGSGVLVDTDTVLTAAHVVGEAGLVRITYGTQVFTGEVRGVLRDGRDLAVIELSAAIDEPVATGASPRVGEPVTIVGFPEGESRLSVVGPVVETPDLARRILVGPLLAVDALSRSGMSGGPAVDADGALVGLLVAAQPGTGTAVVAAIGDLADVVDVPLIDGTCPETA